MRPRTMTMYLILFLNATVELMLGLEMYLAELFPVISLSLFVGGLISVFLIFGHIYSKLGTDEYGEAGAEDE